jgi:hypothetical protein
MSSFTCFFFSFLQLAEAENGKEPGLNPGVYMVSCFLPGVYGL